MAGFEKRSKRYPTDLTDEEWLFIQPFLSPAGKRGHKPETDLRDVLDALRYLARTGSGWRMLYNDCPPWQTVYWWFRRFVRRLLFRAIDDFTLMLDREREGHEQNPTAPSWIVSRSRRQRQKGGALMQARRFSFVNGTLLSIPMADCS